MKDAVIRDGLARACMVRMACQPLEVSSSGCCRFVKFAVGARTARRLAVEVAVVCIHAESRRLSGASKISHDLPRLGLPAPRLTVCGSCRCNGLHLWTREEEILASFGLIEIRDQRTRIHCSLGCVSPGAFEAAVPAG